MLVRDAGDVARGAVRVVAGRVAQHQLAVAPRAASSWSGRREPAPDAVLHRQRQRLARLALAREHAVGRARPRTSTWRHTKRSDALGSSAPGSRPASHSTWKPLQMPSTGPPSRGEARDLPPSPARSARSRRPAGSRRRRSRPGTITASTPLRSRVGVPQVRAARGRRAAHRAARRRPRRTSRGRRRCRRVRSSVSSGLDLVALDQRVREQPLAHLARRAPRRRRRRRRRARPAGRRARSRRPRSRAPAARARPPGPAGRGCPPWA